MRNVLSDTKSRKRTAAGPVGHIGRDRADDLNAISGRRVDHGTPANAVDGNSVNEVRGRLSSADIAREKTERVRINPREAKPADFNANRKTDVPWEQWYEDLWKIKLMLKKQNHG
jgi:hypothetical protein